MNIWVVKYDMGSYFDMTENDILGLPSYDMFNSRKKKYFKTRNAAEMYVFPIVQKAFEFMVEDMKANRYDEEDDEYLEFKERGFIMLRQDELTEDDPLYEFYHDTKESTKFVCPLKNADDRIGFFFCRILKATLH